MFLDSELITSSGFKSDTDILLQKLKNSMSIENVLNIISDHHKIMNNKHLLQALRSLFLLQKSKQYVELNKFKFLINIYLFLVLMYLHKKFYQIQISIHFVIR